MSHLWDPPQKMPRGSLSLGHADHPLATHGIAHSIWTENHHSFHPDVSQPQFCPADIPLSSDVSQPQFCPADIPLSSDISQPQFCPADVLPSPDISHPTLSAGWERRTVQLPQADMSGSFRNAYPENIRGRRFKFPG